VGELKDHIHLHLEHLGPAVIHERLPGIAETCAHFCRHRCHARTDSHPATVHYNMGGIPCSMRGEVVTLRNGDPNSGGGWTHGRGGSRLLSVHGATGWVRIRCWT